MLYTGGMKNNTYILSAIFLITSASPALAQAANTSVKTIRADLASTTKKEKDAANDAIKSQMEAAQREMQQQRDNAVRTVLKNQATRVGIRVGATIDRLQNIMDRVNSRIEKIKNAGAGNTAGAQKYVADAKTSLDKAKASFESMKNAVNSMTSGANATASSTSEVVKSLKSMEKDVEKNLQSTRTSLSKAIGSLKGLATTTNQTN